MNRRIALKELAVSGAEHNPSIRDRKPLGFLRDILLGNRWLVKEMIDHCRISSLPRRCRSWWKR